MFPRPCPPTRSLVPAAGPEMLSFQDSYINGVIHCGTFQYRPSTRPGSRQARGRVAGSTARCPSLRGGLRARPGPTAARAGTRACSSREHLGWVGVNTACVSLQEAPGAGRACVPLSASAWTRTRELTPEPPQFLCHRGCPRAVPAADSAFPAFPPGWAITGRSVGSLIRELQRDGGQNTDGLTGRKEKPRNLPGRTSLFRTARISLPQPPRQLAARPRAQVCRRSCWNEGLAASEPEASPPPPEGADTGGRVRNSPYFRR